MKKITLAITDESKVDTIIRFLQEVRGIQIEDGGADYNIKKLEKLPQSMLQPRISETFHMFNRNGLHERKTI